MVGRNGLLSGYKSQRTQGHRGEEEKLRRKGTSGEEFDRKPEERTGAEPIGKTQKTGEQHCGIRRKQKKDEGEGGQDIEEDRREDRRKTRREGTQKTEGRTRTEQQQKQIQTNT
ncbi:hypothetical protein NC653_040352 [Populus alba x Populus x berolinensis]|uniref:Uncharacterized protein n=1 Tax=Populus alba x Populus x berolinensis TaxID=444605 RepID=A0AAD6LDH2_9ROSI|nr:hypothetical protein NC653_040352 [Populus alba x Populus x berolinensis]